MLMKKFSIAVNDRMDAGGRQGISRGKSKELHRADNSLAAPLLSRGFRYLAGIVIRKNQIHNTKDKKRERLEKPARISFPFREVLWISLPKGRSFSNAL